MEEKKHWKHELSEQFEEEIEDANKYLDLAEEAEEDKCYITANSLELIAHEEYSHAHFLRGRLEEWGMFTHEDKELWEKLERRMGYR